MESPHFSIYNYFIHAGRLPAIPVAVTAAGLELEDIDLFEMNQVTGK